MTHKITIPLIALTLVTGAGFFAAPASAQDGRKHVAPGTRNSVVQSQTKAWRRTSDSRHYRAGLRAGLDRGVVRSRAFYARGYDDGAYRVSSVPGDQYAYGYVRPEGVYGARRYNGYGYSPYAGYDGGYAPGHGGYGPYAAYENGFTPVGALLGGMAGLAVGGATASYRYEQHNSGAWLAYCSAKYRSFDPGSGTFLANDGNRYYCN
jgi:hypothetical protein